MQKDNKYIFGSGKLIKTSMCLLIENWLIKANLQFQRERKEKMLEKKLPKTFNKNGRKNIKVSDDKALSHAQHDLKKKKKCHTKKNHIKIFQNTKGKEQILSKCFQREKTGHIQKLTGNTKYE